MHTSPAMIKIFILSNRVSYLTGVGAGAYNWDVRMHTQYISRCTVYIQMYSIHGCTVYIQMYNIYTDVQYIYRCTVYIQMYSVYTDVQYIYGCTVYTRMYSIYPDVQYINGCIVYIQMYSFHTGVQYMVVFQLRICRPPFFSTRKLLKVTISQKLRIAQ